MATEPTLDWQRLLDMLRLQALDRYRSWFAELEAAQPQRGELEIRAQDLPQLNYLQENCRELFAAAAMRLTRRLLTVRFTCRAGPQGTAASGPALAPDYTFEQFVVGPSNRLAHAACLAASERPGAVYNPLFLHGGSGLGKTHLLQATCARAAELNPDLRVSYQTCEDFVNGLVQAMAQGQLQSFRQRTRELDLLALDDLQFLANRESSQEELFHTFNALHQRGRQLILSADCPPGEIPTLNDRLISRFNWGLVIRVDAPDRETRQAILRQKARIRGVELPDEVIDLIAEQFHGNIRLLEGALTTLVTAAQVQGKPLDRRTACELLQLHASRSQPPLHIGDILQAVSAVFGVRPQELLSRKRSRSISFPRQVVMYLARKLTTLSLEEIGMQLGGRDHSTVLYAERVVETAQAADPQVAQMLSQLTSRLLSHH